MSNHLFSQVPRAEIPRSSFDRSHTYKTTMDSGYLIPVLVEEVLPGDTFNVDVNSFCRLASPLKVPVMDDMYLDFQFFFVPNRLVWDNWQRFNGEQKNPGDSTDFLVPQLKLFTRGNLPDEQFDVHMMKCLGSESLYDYMGIPIPLSVSVHTGGEVWSINALPFRAYNLIWNEWYRDENLQDSVPVDTNDEDWNVLVGTNDPSTYKYKLLRRGKRHDYFTSALPWPQKGPGVELPLGLSAPVYGNGNALTFYGNLGNIPAGMQNVGPYALSANGSNINVASIAHSGFGNWSPKKGINSIPDGVGANAGTPITRSTLALASKEDIVSWYGSLDEGNNPKDYTGLVADLSQSTGATINSLRQAFQLQRLYERDARGGTRYIEILKAHFGVTSPDARLQRPEYLGGWSQSIQVNPVAQTSLGDAATGVGTLGAYAVSASSRRGFDKSFVEHGYIIGLASVRANLTYQQGLNRMWSRKGRFDFYWPVLAHLGEQAILNKEIYLDYTQSLDGTAEQHSSNEDVFGYQERWAEYRYFPNLVTGKMRSNPHGQSLDIYHLGQFFENCPKLNSTFIEENPPIDRVVAVPSEPQFLLDLYFKARVARPMPVYSVPGLVDHF